MRKQRTSIVFLLVCFYLFHALSPLIYCLDSPDLQTLPVSLQAALTNLASPAEQDRVLIQSDSENKQVSSTPVSQVLLKKKRAISITFKKIIPLLSVQFYGAPAQNASCTALCIPDDSLKTSDGFQFYHSGVSPPSA